MKESGKKAVLILGHVICIFIIIYCFAQSKEVVFVSPTPAIFSEKDTTTENIISDIPVKKPTEVPEVIPTITSIEEQEILPVVMPTEAPAVSSAPTEAPTPTPVQEETVAISPTTVPEITETTDLSEGREDLKQQVLQKIADGTYSELDNKSDEWWFYRKKDHVASGSGEFFNIKEYQGFYLDKSASDEDKVIYLTLDCGYGSSNTKVILDVLKKHDVKATFFVTKMFMDAEPESVRRMVEEGHTVGNHTVSHKKLPTLTDEEIYQEIILCEERFFEITGMQMPLFFRPPGGAYSKRTMQLTEDLGYKTIFWSIAYYDYNLNDQPGKQYVIDHFEDYHHNGAIPLMHNDSSSNRDAMDAVITFLKEEGYRFGSLEELILETD